MFGSGRPMGTIRVAVVVARAGSAGHLHGGLGGAVEVVQLHRESRKTSWKRRVVSHGNGSPLQQTQRRVGSARTGLSPPGKRASIDGTKCVNVIPCSAMALAR